MPSPDGNQTRLAGEHGPAMLRDAAMGFGRLATTSPTANLSHSPPSPTWWRKHESSFSPMPWYGSMPDDGAPLRDGGIGATAYAEAVGSTWVLVLRLSDRSSTICSWDIGYTKIRNTFGRQAIQMTWDYAEGNVFSDSTGNFTSLLQWVAEVSDRGAHWGIWNQFTNGCVITVIAQIAKLSPPIRHTTTILDTQTFRTSSTSGCVDRCDLCFRISSPLWPCPRLTSW